MEAAFAVAALVVVLVFCVTGLTAVSMHIRCIDAAREAARLAARGDDGIAVALSIAPEGADVRVDADGASVVATVTARPPLLLGLAIAARAVAMVEPGQR